MAVTRKVEIEIPELINTSTLTAGTPYLVCETDKGYRGDIRSSVRVEWANEGFRTTILGGGFQQCARSTPGRATQKAIDTQHAAVFTPEKLALLRAQAITFYSKER